MFLSKRHIRGLSEDSSTGKAYFFHVLITCLWRAWTILEWVNVCLTLQITPELQNFEVGRRAKEETMKLLHAPPMRLLIPSLKCCSTIYNNIVIDCAMRSRIYEHFSNKICYFRVFCLFLGFPSLGIFPGMRSGVQLVGAHQNSSPTKQS